MTNSTESPSSVTYSLVRSGYNLLFTVRGESGIELLKAMDTIEKKLTEGGYKPQEKRSFGSPKPPAEIVPDRKCPKCGQPLVFATKGDGTKFIKCSTNKWNAMLKKAEGCPFVEWPKDDSKQTNSGTSSF